MGDLGSVPGLGRFPGEGKGYPLQYSSLENPMDRGPWKATVLGVIKSRTRLSDFHFHTASQHWISWVAYLGLIFSTELQAVCHGCWPCWRQYLWDIYGASSVNSSCLDAMKLWSSKPNLIRGDSSGKISNDAGSFVKRNSHLSKKSIIICVKLWIFKANISECFKNLIQKVNL